MQPVYLIVLLDKKHNYVYIAQLIYLSSFCIHIKSYHKMQPVYLLFNYVVVFV